MKWDKISRVGGSSIPRPSRCIPTGTNPDDLRLQALISELSSASERFKQLWERADVGYPKGDIHIRHPEVGDLYLTRTQLDLAQSPGQHVLTLHAPTNSASMRALDQLRASLPIKPVSNR
jgi:hypothetical protein